MTNLNTIRARALIEDRGFTHAHVAKKCFIKYGTLNHILGGRHNPSPRVLALLASVLQTTVAYLTDTSSEINPPKEQAA